MQFVDANVFLRFLTRDDPVKAERVKALLERAERGEVDLLTSESVIAELVFVLSSPKLYNLGHDDPHPADAHRFAQGVEAAETGGIPAGA